MNSNDCWINKARGYPFVTDNPKYFPLPKKAPMPPGVGGYGPIQPPKGTSHVMPFPFGVNTGDFLSSYHNEEQYPTNHMCNLNPIRDY